MGKTNWKRVFLGGLLAGVVLNVFYFGILGAFYETDEFRTSLIIFYFITGMMTIWLYSAIRPRYGSGLQAAVIAGLVIGGLCGLTYIVSANSASVFTLYTAVAMHIIAALAGAWVYKEQS